MPSERVHSAARRDTRHAIREIFREVSGHQLNANGEFSAATLEENLYLSPATTDLYHWLRAIFSRLMDVRGVSGDSLTGLRETVMAAARGVKEACERGTSRDAIARWVLQHYSLPSLRYASGIDFGSANDQEESLAPGVVQAPQQSAFSHGVFLPPPLVLNTRTQGLPPMLPGIASPVAPQAGQGLPRIQTYEEWLASQHQPGQHSLAKKVDQRLGSSMTARKAAIYGTTPEEWMARSMHPF
ncbi:hypothetical protein OF846_003062 [Rhodotorula toruloides]|nr:hypothetical protein OF846_003062 [Rhodotorula toruloides]